LTMATESVTDDYQGLSRMALSAGDPDTCQVPDLFTRDELRAKFGWEEYFIFGMMLLVSLLIGVYFWWKGQKSNAQFLLGGRSMGTLPMTMSLIASFMSAITLLGTPSELYRFGTQYVLLVLAYPLVMGSAAHFYLPVFWKLKVSTSYEYLEWRFHKSVRILASCCFTLQMVLYMSIVVYTPALAVEQITGFPLDAACAVIFFVCILYTTIGGIKAVMWTDTFQALVMFGSFLAIIIKGNADACGSSKVFDENYKTGRIQLFNFSTDITTRHSVWTMIIGGYFTWVSVYGINQTQVQRYMSVKDKSQAVKAIWLNVLGIGSLLLICAYGGLVTFAYYNQSGCDPISIKLVDKADQIFPIFVMQVMGDIPCVPGLFVAGVFSGALSTVSSGLNSLAAVTMQDFIVGNIKTELTEKKKVILTKALALSYGIVAYCVVFLVKYLPGVLEAALGIFGIVGGPVLGAFTLGMFVPWCNSIGAFVGCLSSLIFTMWFGFGQTVARNFKAFSTPLMPLNVTGCSEAILNATLKARSEPPVDPCPEGDCFQHLRIYETSYMWFSAIPCLMCVGVGILVTLITHLAKVQPYQDPKKLNPDLISPALPKLFACWPEFIRRNFEPSKMGLGSEYVMSDRERQLANNQIQTDEDKPGDGEDMGPHPGQQNGTKSNPGFEMDPM